MVWILMLAAVIAVVPCSGCSKTGANTKREAVVAWLEKKPTLTTLEHLRKPDEFATYEQWVKAGRKIEGLEVELLALYREEGGRVRTVVICDALRFFGTPRSIPVLTGIMTDPSAPYNARQEAITAIQDIGDTSAVGPLCEFIVSDLYADGHLGKELVETLKLSAIGTLGVLGDPNAIPYIEQARHEPPLDQSDQEFVQFYVDKLRDGDNESERREE